MAIALINSAIAQNVDTHVVSSPAVDLTSANLIVAVIVDSSTVAVAPLSDNFANTWLLASTIIFAGGSRIRIVYAVNAITGAAFVLTVGNASLVYSPAVALMGFSLADVSVGWDGQHGEVQANATVLQPGPITPLVDNSLVVAGCSIGGGVAHAFNDAPMSDPLQLPPGGPSYGIGISYVIQTTKISAAPRFNGPNFQTAAVASFAPRILGTGGASSLFNDL